jgi:hypothetical protein
MQNCKNDDSRAGTPAIAIAGTPSRAGTPAISETPTTAWTPETVIKISKEYSNITVDTKQQHARRTVKFKDSSGTQQKWNARSKGDASNTRDVSNRRKASIRINDSNSRYPLPRQQQRKGAPEVKTSSHMYTPLFIFPTNVYRHMMIYKDE